MRILAFSGASELFQPLFGLLWHSDSHLRELATEGLEKFNHIGYDLVFLDQLLDLMQDADEDVRGNIARIIASHYFRPGRMLDRGYAPLSGLQIKRIIKLAEKADDRIKMSLLKVLGLPTLVYLAAIPLLIESLSDPIYPGVIIAAAEALEEVKPPTQLAVDLLINCLRHEHEKVRWQSAQTLGRMGLAEPRVITALLVAINDPHSLVRQKSVISLGVLGRKDKNPVIIERLLELTYDTDERVRERATHQLGDQGTNEPYIVQRLVEILQDPAPTVQTEAIGALGKLGNIGHIPLLEKFITPEFIYTIYSEIVGQQAENAIIYIRNREA